MGCVQQSVLHTICNDNELFTSSEMVEFLQNDVMFEDEKVTLLIYQIVIL